MSVASGLLVAGRRRVGNYVPVRAARQNQDIETAARPRHLMVMARGVVWAALLVAACALGPVAVGVVMVPAAAIASVSAARAMQRPRRPLSLAVAAGGPAVAAVSFIAADTQGANLGLALALLVCLYDAASYINGDGRRAGGAFGVGAGLLTVAVFAVFVAAVLDPPFKGYQAWLVVGASGLLAPLGVWLAGRATKWSRLPALRRVDSMILTAPMWAILVATVASR